MIDPSAFREATRTNSVSYPVPFVLVSLLGFALSCFVLAVWFSGPAEWFILIIGGITALLALGLAAYAVLRKPELLRSERNTLTHSYLEWLAAHNLGDSRRESGERVMLTLLGPDTHKPPPRSGRGINEEQKS